MSEKFEKTCPHCGAGHGTGSDFNRSFLQYEPNPNGAQTEFGWIEDLPPVYALVCLECGEIVNWYVMEDPENFRDGDASDYRIDRELT